MAKRGKILKSHKSTKTKSVERPSRIRNYEQFFLIVCEDEATEPAYFKQFEKHFPDKTIFFKFVGTGRDPKGVVEQAIAEREIFKTESNKEIDFVWAIFDKDDADENETKIKNFEEAFLIAQEENIQIAYSNEVFELWLLLHLTNVDAKTPIPRREIYYLLERTIRNSNQNLNAFVYEHGNSNIVEIIARIGNESLAIQKAEFLLDYHKNAPPLEANPSTRIHTLVKELRAWIAFYNYVPE